ncbi:MAG: hypothetical protein M1142_01105 [Patescibacteria group bacterium]|nr:hypothetical protein [Patescibacteria group bacterium]
MKEGESSVLLVVRVMPLADGLKVAVIKDPLSDSPLSVVGRTTREAIDEAITRVEFEVQGKEYVPKACVYNPRNN